MANEDEGTTQNSASQGGQVTEGGILELDKPGAPAPVAPPPPPTVEYDPLKERENVRGRIALFLIGILAAIVLASFLLLWGKPFHSDKLKDILSVLFGPVVALVGAATGYYFGAGGSTGMGTKTKP